MMQHNGEEVMMEDPQTLADKQDQADTDSSNNQVMMDEEEPSSLSENQDPNSGENNHIITKPPSIDQVLTENRDVNLVSAVDQDEDGNVPDDNDVVHHDEKESSTGIAKMTQFPLGRVKNIMKLDPEVNMASQESVFAVTKALEMFVESLAKEAYLYTERAKKKTMAKTDVDKAIDAADCLAFLEGAMDD